MDHIKLCNKIRMEAQEVSNTGFPLEVFPEKMKRLLLSYNRQNNFPIEFIATSCISAATAALGDTHRIHVKGDWVNNNGLYIMLVGLPGRTKSAPLMAAYKPLERKDDQYYVEFRQEWEKYETAISGGDTQYPKPVLRQTIISDFTPEALLRTLDNNKRGIVILVDELMGMFNSANRYNKGQLIENLLSAYSGGSIFVNRANSPIPMRITNPCVNIIGTIQSERIPEIIKQGHIKNGLLDRFLIVFPRDQTISDWVDDAEEQSNQYSPSEVWSAIIDKILSLDYAVNKEGRQESVIMEFTQEARTAFYNWRNSIAHVLNNAPDKTKSDRRAMKCPYNASRLALALQVIRWACGEASLDHVDLVSTRGAIRLCEFYEDSYQYLIKEVNFDLIDGHDQQYLERLGKEFRTDEAIKTGMEFGIHKRCVYDKLKEFQEKHLIRKIRMGFYEKI